METIRNIKHASIPLNLSLKLRETSRNNTGTVKEESYIKNKLNSISILKSLNLDFSHKLPRIKQYQNHKGTRQNANREELCANFNRFKSPQPNSRNNFNFSVGKDSLVDTNHSTIRNEYDCRNLGTSPKINTNFKFKQIKNKANQLRRQLVISLDKRIRKDCNNNEQSQEEVNSPSTKINDSFSIVMQSSNFSTKFTRKPQENKLQILTQSKNLVSEINSPKLDTILSLCRSKFCSPKPINRTFVDIDQKKKDITPIK